MKTAPKSVWRYGLFQIPAILFGILLVVTILTFALPIPCSWFWRLLSLGLLGISLAWTLTLPFDRLLQGQTQLTMDLSGRLALGNALFWTTLLISLMFSKLPTIRSACLVLPILSVPQQEVISLDWSSWHADIWNELFYQQDIQGRTGSKATFSFVVSEDKSLSEINVRTNDQELETFVAARIKTIEDQPILKFAPLSHRTHVLYEGNVVVCTEDSEGCGDPATSNDYKDTEEFTQ